MIKEFFDDIQVGDLIQASEYVNCKRITDFLVLDISSHKNTSLSVINNHTHVYKYTTSLTLKSLDDQTTILYKISYSENEIKKIAVTRGNGNGTFEYDINDKFEPINGFHIIRLYQRCSSMGNQ